MANAKRHYRYFEWKSSNRHRIDAGESSNDHDLYAGRDWANRYITSTICEHDHCYWASCSGREPEHQCPHCACGPIGDADVDNAKRHGSNFGWNCGPGHRDTNRDTVARHHLYAGGHRCQRHHALTINSQCQHCTSAYCNAGSESCNHRRRRHWHAHMVFAERNHGHSRRRGSRSQRQPDHQSRLDDDLYTRCFRHIIGRPGHSDSHGAGCNGFSADVGESHHLRNAGEPQLRPLLWIS